MTARNEWRDEVWASELPALPRIVALAFADHAGLDGVDVWVPVRRLAARTGMSATAAQRCVAYLRATGWLVVSSPGSGRRATRYALAVGGVAFRLGGTQASRVVYRDGSVVFRPGPVAFRLGGTDSLEPQRNPSHAGAREVPVPSWFLEQRGSVGRMPE